MKPIKNLFITLCLTFSLACNSNSREDSNKFQFGDNSTAKEAASDEIALKAFEPEGAETANNGNVSFSSNMNRMHFMDRNNETLPLLMRSASLEIKVQDLFLAMQFIDSLEQVYGAYIANQSLSTLVNEPKVKMLLKVPANKLDQFISAIKLGKGEVHSFSLSAKDVGEEYNDLEMRLATKRKVLERYQSILLRAGSIKEVLEAEREIGNLMEEIERVEGRMNFLKDRTTYAELNLVFFQWKDLSVTETRYGFDDELLKALNSGWKGVKYFLLIFIGIWPLLLLSLAAFVLFKKYKGYKKQTGVS